MASTICLVSFVVAEKEGSHTGGVSIRGILSGLGLRTKDVFTREVFYQRCLEPKKSSKTYLKHH